LPVATIESGKPRCERLGTLCQQERLNSRRFRSMAYFSAGLGLVTPTIQLAEANMSTHFKNAHPLGLVSDPEFARWLAEEYVPMAGGWQY
jgi:hypothetical protein